MIDQNSNSRRKLFVVAPVYNEAGSLRAFVAEVERVLTPLAARYAVFLTLVDDGSADGSLGVIRDLVAENRTKPIRVLGVELSRNFGHQGAISAGLVEAFGRSSPDSLFVLMDSDLEHPPSYLPRIVQSLESGKDHVQMVRQETDERGRKVGKDFTSRWFYWLFHKLSGIEMPPGSADYRGMNHSVVKAFLSLPETDRFNRGLFWWVGFAREEIPYTVGSRIAGESKYSWRRMIRLAEVGILSFSSKPLILVLGGSVLLSFLFCVLFFAHELYAAFVLHETIVLGWPTIVVLISFWGGVLSLGQLMLALYVSRIYTEVKRRPGFIARRTHE